MAVLAGSEAEDQEIVREFLVESHENLTRLDQDLVELENQPKNAALLSSIFRTIHTIKGTCGFFGFSTLERITHQAENLLSQLREGQRELTPLLVSLILETVDATRTVLASIEKSGEEGPERFEALAERLGLAAQLSVEVENPLTPDPVLMAAPADSIAETGSLDDWAMPVEVEPAKKEEREATARQEDTRSKEDRREADRSKEEDAKPHSTVADSNVRVGVGLLDKLMDLVGELVLTRNQILQFNTEREDAALNATSQRLNLITTELQAGVMKTRMQPIGGVWSQLPRVVRDMSVSLGKQIRLQTEGADTELDRTIIEAIKDPLVHLIRNSCDHGIESPEIRLAAGKPVQGRLTLRAYHEGGQVNIEIGDDGAGISVARVKQKAIEKGLLRPEQVDKLSDREALNLIFLPGFSTAQKVTNISGRGVGMDVVKSHIEKIGGTVDLFSRAGEGATVRIKIPLTLAIVPGLVITSGGERFVIPQISLLELIRIEGDATERHIEYVHGTPVLRRRGRLLPIAYLNQVLDLQSSSRREAVNIVVLQAEDRQFGLVVDGINDTQEIVVKPLGKQLKGLPLYAGATIMGDGRVALILDVLGIGQSSGVFAEVQEQGRASGHPQMELAIELQRLLLFRAGSFERLAVPLSLVARLELFPRAMIECAGGGPVIQYRERILPLVSLRAVLESGGIDEGDPADPVQVVVFTDGERMVGMLVDQILDIVEEAVTVRQKVARKGLLGSGVIGNRVTDFLDLNEIVQAAAKSWFQDGGDTAVRKVLLVETSSFSRGMIRSGLDMAGYRVFEAATPEDAVRELEKQPVDIVVASLDLPRDGSSELLAAIQAHPEWMKIPVLALSSSPVAGQTATVLRAGFQDCQTKFDHERMLESVAKLIALPASSDARAVDAERWHQQ